MSFTDFFTTILQSFFGHKLLPSAITAPSTLKKNPFEQTSIIEEKQKNENVPVLKNVRASDYVTPQKYLDGAEIPTYYSFQSNMVAIDEAKHGMINGFDVDRRLTLPTRTHIRFLVTASDVIHSFSVPSLSLKIDAMPGRISRCHTFILREGVFYGQCSEMCGALHSFMPIVIEAVSPEAFAAHARKFYKD